MEKKTDDLVKRIAEKYVWPLDIPDFHDVYLGGTTTLAFRIVHAILVEFRDDRLFFARKIVESAIREALEEIATKAELLAAVQSNPRQYEICMTAAGFIREQVKAPAETEGKNG